MRGFWSSVLVAGVLCTPLRASITADLPKHTGYVNDFANLLNGDRRAELEQLLRETEKETAAEVVLATVTSLEGMSVEEYANRLFNDWGIGKDAVDNGVLILVAPVQREMRIEVGYGLEPVMPDGLAGQIIRDVFLPRFRDDDYPAGIERGVRRVVEVVRRNQVLTPEEREALEKAAQDRAPWFVTVPFFGAFVGIGFFMLGAGLGSKTGFAVLFGSLFGGVPLLMSMVPVFGAPLWVMGPWALFCLVMGIRNGRRGSSWIAEMRAPAGKRSRHRGWVMGGGSRSRSSGSGSSSSSRSSSSSFGGGSSGGGGASGRW